MPKGEDRGIRLNFWEGLVEGLPVAIILFFFSPVGAGMFMLVVALHHTIWNQIHLEMHQPTKRFFANWSLYKFCARHHFLHHRYPDKNFNVAFQLGIISAEPLRNRLQKIGRLCGPKVLPRNFKSRYPKSVEASFCLPGVLWLEYGFGSTVPEPS